MKQLQATKYLIGSPIAAAAFAACSENGEEYVADIESVPNHSRMLSLDVSETTFSNDIFSSYDDLYHYELYASVTENFSDTNTLAAFVSAEEENLLNDSAISTNLIPKFDLALLNIEELSSTRQLYVSLQRSGNRQAKVEFHGSHHLDSVLRERERRP